MVLVLGSDMVATPMTTSSATRARRKRSRARRLTTIDRRTVTYRRICELRSLFSGALMSAGIEISPMLALRIEAAAQASTLAEVVRGRFLREGVGDLDEILRAERRADTLLKILSSESPRWCLLRPRSVLARPITSVQQPARRPPVLPEAPYVCAAQRRACIPEALRGSLRANCRPSHVHDFEAESLALIQT